MQDDRLHYDALIRPIEDRMLRTIWGVTRNAEDAEDALQDALALIWRKWDRISTHANPQALVLRICLNMAYDAVRRNTRRRQHEQPGESAAEYAQESRALSPADTLDSRERESAILKAINDLSRNQSAAVFMRCIQGHSYEEIASVLGCGTATARKHLERGREKLRALLKPIFPQYTKEATLEQAQQTR